MSCGVGGDQFAIRLGRETKRRSSTASNASGPVAVTGDADEVQEAPRLEEIPLYARCRWSVSARVGMVDEMHRKSRQATR